MKAREAVRRDCLRMLKTAVKNREIEERRELDEQEIQSIISSQIKKRKEAIRDFQKGHREDLIEKEEAEIQFLLEYLPKQMSPGEIEAVLMDILSNTEAKGPKDLGKVMKEAMANMAGKAEGKTVSEIAKRLLTASAS